MEEISPGVYICRDITIVRAIRSFSVNIRYDENLAERDFDAIIRKLQIHTYIPSDIFNSITGGYPFTLDEWGDPVELDTFKLDGQDGEFFDAYLALAISSIISQSKKILTYILIKGLNPNAKFNSYSLLEWSGGNAKMQDVLIMCGADVIEYMCSITKKHGENIAVLCCRKMKKYLSLRERCIYEIIANKGKFSKDNIRSLPCNNLTRCLYDIFEVEVI